MSGINADTSLKELAALVSQALERAGVTATLSQHPDTPWYVEFPPGPLAFGETYVADGEACVVQTEYGPLRVVTPTQSIMDRMAAYVHWHDNQSLDQAVMVASRQQIDWTALHEWARRDGVDTSVIGSLRSRVERIHSAEGSGQNG